MLVDVQRTSGLAQLKREKFGESGTFWDFWSVSHAFVTSHRVVETPAWEKQLLRQDEKPRLLGPIFDALCLAHRNSLPRLCSNRVQSIFLNGNRP